MKRLADALAPRIGPVLLANLTTRYPYHDSHVFEDGDLPHDPLAAHPAFGNSFDWHSSVHTHWTALQLAERGDADLAAVFERNLDAAKIAAEIEYLRRRTSYERPYGWAWALLLAGAAQTTSVAGVRSCGRELASLGAVVGDAALKWLEVLTLPVRHGVHSNTAFAMGLMHDACDELRLVRLKESIERRACEWFGGDKGWPSAWERSGNDFLSPGLAEADLMRRVLDGRSFAAWWKEFVPGLSSESSLLSVVGVPDVADGQIVHLHGLNISRASAVAAIGRTLGDSTLIECAHRLYDAGAGRAVSGHYSELHWLPTFAWLAAVAIDEAVSARGYGD